MKNLNLAVFIGPDTLADIHDEHPNVSHDDIPKLFRKKFSEEISEWLLDEACKGEDDDVSDIFPGDVYVRVLDDVSLKFGTALAGYLGFCADYTEEDTWHGVIEVESK